MVRAKQVPVGNVHKNKLNRFFQEATKSTPVDSPNAAGSPRDSKSSNGSSNTSQSTSKKSSSRKSSSAKSKSQKSSSGRSPSRRSSAAASTAVKKRLAPGMAAIQEIRRLQRSTHLLIPAAAFIRVVKDVLLAEEERRRRDDASLTDGFLLKGMRFSADAIACLQEAAEVQLTNFFTLSYCCTLHARRKTLMVQDCQLTRLILGRTDPINP